MRKKVLISIVLLLAAIQFIRPARNRNDKITPDDLTVVLVPPEEVRMSLKNACYDCHSNNTDYPWYFEFQPVAWILTWHINEGKSELNFSEYGTYSRRRQTSKLDAIANNIEDGEMPLKSYKILHKDARLRQDQKNLIIKWARNESDRLQSER